jgi:hypothetical protein
MIVEGFKQIGEWLQERMAKKAEDLTKEQLDGMSKNDLIMAVLELQGNLKTARKETKKKSDSIWNLFMKFPTSSEKHK